MVYKFFWFDTTKALRSLLVCKHGGFAKMFGPSLPPSAEPDSKALKWLELISSLRDIVSPRSGKSFVAHPLPCPTQGSPEADFLHRRFRGHAGPGVLVLSGRVRL